MRLRLIISLVIILASITNVEAKGIDGDSLSIKYKINEEWYFQAQGGISYMVAENISRVSFWKELSPQGTFSIGKQFSPIWGARLQFVGGKDKGVYYESDANSPIYSFSHLGVFGVGTFNITNLFYLNKKDFDQKPWNISALLGVGMLYTSFGFTKNISGSKIDLNNSTFLSVLAGVEVARKITPNWDISLELSSNWMSHKYNGQTSASNSKWGLNGMVNLLVGVRYTINRAKKKVKRSPNPYKAEMIVPKQEQHKTDAEPSEIVVATKHDTTRMALIYYSVEELLEMVESNVSIQGKQLAKTEIISFDYGQFTIKTFNSIYLDKVAELMKKANIVLLIRGFSTDESVLNDRLAQQRIKAVRDYLIKCGIERDRLVYQCVAKSELSSDYKDKEQIVELEILTL